MESQENYSTKGDFLFFMDHLKFVKSIRVKVIIYDNSLKMQNDLWDIKNLEEISDKSQKNGFSREDIIRMPANNFSIIYRNGS